MKNRKIRETFILNSVIALFLGAIIYLLFREDTFFSNHVRRYVSFPKVLTNALPNEIGVFIKYYLADMAWAYALTFAVGAVFEGDNGQLLLSGIISLGFEALVEEFQKTRWIPGTFDWKDVALEAAASVFALILIKYIERENNYEKDHKTN